VKDVTADEDVVDFILLAIINESREYLTVFIVTTQTSPMNVSSMSNFNH
jgi:predicted component of type VI protein secretion system